MNSGLNCQCSRRDSYSEPRASDLAAPSQRVGSWLVKSTLVAVLPDEGSIATLTGVTTSVPSHITAGDAE